MKNMIIVVLFQKIALKKKRGNTGTQGARKLRANLFLLDEAVNHIEFYVK